MNIYYVISIKAIIYEADLLVKNLCITLQIRAMSCIFLLKIINAKEILKSSS